MRKLSLILSALVVLCSPSPAAAREDFSSIEAFLKATLRAEDSLSFEAKGDLNGDGLGDWAGVIQRRQADSSPTYQLYALLRRPRGGYRVAEKSREESIGGWGCCWVEHLEIRRAGIYIQNNAKTAAVMEATTHQFKLYKGEWRLVGMKTYITDFSRDATVMIDTDVNLLTGAVIEKRQRGDDRPVVRSRRRKFAAYLLKDFDFSSVFGNEVPRI